MIKAQFEDTREVSELLRLLNLELSKIEFKDTLNTRILLKARSNLEKALKESIRWDF
jgi:hypothetical protein